MPDSSCQIAFKEWAAVCEALAAGRQTIILRKGGIQEGREGFRVQHPQFWLYPTNFHQAADALSPDAADFVERALAGTKPGSGVSATETISVRLFAEVATVHELATEAQVLRLAGHHIWSEETVRQRFHYKQPGLFLLIVRAFTLPTPVEVMQSDEMAGCKSWVTLPEPLSTAGLSPVLTQAQFSAQAAAIASAVA